MTFAHDISALMFQKFTHFELKNSVESFMLKFIYFT